MQRAGDDEPEAEYLFRGRFQTLLWGPTTDNVAEFVGILEGVAVALDIGQSQGSP
ncbi:hypothetical protein ACIOTI_35780 [Streptomyces sp. NPDC087843]|uniref:hypothetical protein n=1 Tax=Streptomyces sp. NPDC087843 TaxID=3365804 RepID=UPI0038016EBE